MQVGSRVEEIDLGGESWIICISVQKAQNADLSLTEFTVRRRKIRPCDFGNNLLPPVLPRM